MKFELKKSSKNNYQMFVDGKPLKIAWSNEVANSLEKLFGIFIIDEVIFVTLTETERALGRTLTEEEKKEITKEIKRMMNESIGAKN